MPETVPGLVQAFIASDFVAFVDNGKAPRSDYGLREYDTHKLGVVNHIPECATLEQLTAYFNGGGSPGSVHFGNGREQAGYLEWQGRRIPVSQVHQYLPTTGPLSPWAQGVSAWQDSPDCVVKVPPLLRSLPLAAANCAFISIENVAMTGGDGVTVPQFNANVLLRAWAAAYFEFPITPETQLWHAEFNPAERCFDPGWSGELENAMQAAARALLSGDTSLLRGVLADAAPPPQVTPGESQPGASSPPVVDQRLVQARDLLNAVIEGR